MKDTSPEVEKIYNEMIMAKSPQERLRMAGEMYDSAKQLVIAGILKDQPNIDEKQLRKEVFLRMYGNDFSPEEMEKIINKLFRLI